LPLTDSEVIDAALRNALSAGSSTITSDAPLRERARFRLQELSDDVLTEAPFWFRMATSGSITTVASQEWAAAPSDFGYLMDQSHIYNPARSVPMRAMDADVINAFRRNSPSTGSPAIYCLNGIDATTKLPQIQLYPTPDGVYTLSIGQYVKHYPDIVDRPNAFTATALGGGVLTGAYQWKATFVTALGECEGGPVTPASGTPLTLAAEAGYLTNIPISNVHRVSARRIYRTEAGGAVFKLSGEIPDNVTTTATDNVADILLGADMPTTAESVSGMNLYPEDFHITVFVRGLSHRMLEASGDRTQWQEDWLKSVKKRWAEHRQNQNFPQALAPYGMPSGPSRNLSWRYRIS
jgi:hypothetical protein